MSLIDQARLNPNSTATLSSRLRYQNLTVQGQDIDVNTSNFTAPVAPQAQTFGDGEVLLTGSVIAAGTPAANYAIGTLPVIYAPLEDSYAKVVVLRAGALIDNAIKINGAGDSVASVTVTTPGSYATIPALGTAGPGTGAILNPVMQAVSATVNAAGNGIGSYANGDTVTLSGGTHSITSILTVASTKLLNASVNAAGTGYAPTNTIALTSVGGATTTPAGVTVTSTKLVSVAVNAGGSGYLVGDTITLAGGVSSPAAVLTVATVSTGAVATFTISTAGVFTTNSATFTQASTSGSGTGATFNTAVFGVGVVTATTAGVFTTNPTSFTQTSTSGSGTGATFNTPIYGVNTATVSTAGAYTVLPSNPISQASTSGSGAGATFNALWGLLSVTVANGGSGMTNSSTLVISGGGGAGGGAGSLVLDATGGQITLITAPTVGDVVRLDGVSCFVAPYN